MANDIPIEISDKISAAIEQKLKAIGAAARSAHSDIEILKKSLRSFSPAAIFKQAATGIKSYNTAVSNANKTVRQLTTANNTAATSLGRVTQQANRAAQAMGTLSQRGQQAGNNFREFLALAGTVVGVQQFVDLADAATVVANKIKTVSYNTKDYLLTQEQLYQLANRTRTSVESVVDAYVRYAKVLLPLRKTQQEVLDFTETLTKGFRAAGKTSGEAASGVIQLGQALQKGRLDGDELRSVLENMPIEVTNALAKSLNASVGELRDLGAEGKITRDVIYNAITSAADDIDRLFARTTGTIGDALTVLRNNAIKFFSEQSASAQVLANAILFIGDNLNWLIPVVLAFGAAWGTVALANIVTSFASLTLAVGAATAPMWVFVAAVTAGVGLLALMAEVVARLTGKFEDWQAWLQGTTDAIGDTLEGLIDMGEAALGIDQINQKAKDLEANFTASRMAVENTNVAIKGIAGGVTSVEAVKRALEGTKTAAKDTETNATAAAGAVMSISGSYNGVINVQKALAAAAGSADDLKNAGNDAYESVVSISGQHNGIYRLKTAVDAFANSLKTSTQNAEALVKVMQNAAKVGTKLATTLIPGLGGIDKGGYGTNITGNRSGGSIQNLGNNATGGSYMIGGKAGIDKNMVKFNASKGERVDILTRRQQKMEDRLWAMASAGGQTSGAQTVNFYITTPDAESFRRSRRQISSDMKLVGGAA